MKDGIFPGLPRAQYDAIEAVNISLLLEGRKSMASLKYARDNPKPATDDLTLGIMLHKAVLEPSVFDKDVAESESKIIIFPHPDCEAKVRRWKDWDAFARKHQNERILTEKEYADETGMRKEAIAMRDALRAFPPMGEMLNSKGAGELTCVWTDKETGLRCKRLIDRVNEWHGYTAVLEVKTCQDARKEHFAKSISKFGYHIAAAWTLEALNCAAGEVDRRFFWVCVEKSPPYLCQWHDAHDENDTLIDEGRKVFRRLLNEYASCKKSDKWPGYHWSDSPEPISLNKWDLES